MTIAERVEVIRAALRHVDSIVLQELLEGVRDRVVRAVTFLAMLELVKRREITVEQAEPWGPIVARPLDRTTSAAGPTSTRSAGMIDAATDAPTRRAGRSTTRPTGRAGSSSPRPRSKPCSSSPSGPSRGARSRALARIDLDTVDARLGDLEVSLAGRGIRLVVSGDRVELVTAPEAGELIARYVGAEALPRLSPAALETLAIVAYGQPITRAGIERIRGVDSDYTVRALLHRRLIVELGRSEAPGRPFLYGTGFDFLERFGLTSLEELPPLDADAAAQVDEARADQGRRRGTAGRPRPDRRRPAPRAPERARRAPPEGPRGRGRRVAPRQRGADRRRSRHGRRAGRRDRPAGGPERRQHRRRRPPDRGAARTLHLVLHKPIGVTSTVRDRHADRTVLDLVPPALRREARALYPVGRLDRDSEGLLLLTNDGAWAEPVLHPRHGVEREYAIGLDLPLGADQRHALETGIELEEGIALVDHLRPATRPRRAASRP